LESEKYIDQKMKKYFPDDKILSEETQNKLRDFSGRVRMIDPLDGTKEFIQSSPFYALMI